MGGGYEEERLQEDLSALPPSKAKPGLFCIRTKLHRFEALCFIRACFSVFLSLLCFPIGWHVKEK